MKQGSLKRNTNKSSNVNLKSQDKNSKNPQSKPQSKKISNTQQRPQKKQQLKAKGNSKCPISAACGGCSYIDMSYEEQLKKKLQAMDKLFAEFGGVKSIIGMDDPYYYRNKVNATFHRKKNGEIISGTYAEGTHQVLPVEHCFIENKKAQEIIASIRTLVKSFKITVHNEDTGYGLLKHVMVRVGRKANGKDVEIMVVLVTANPVFPSKKNFAKALLDLHPEITTIVQNINEKHTSMVLGTRNQVLYGKGYIEDYLLGKRYRISPTSFYQVNAIQMEKLYQLAIDYAGLTGEERVIDAYCGTGTIGMTASDKAKEVIGVELNKEAVKDAITNAKVNAVKNIQFYSNDAGKFMVHMAEQGEHCDVVFMDPPRSGSTPEFIKSVHRLSPKRVVYISCGPETLARDLKLLTKDGEYKVEKLVAVDMFPFTEHCEVVAKLKFINP